MFYICMCQMNPIHHPQPKTKKNLHQQNKKKENQRKGPAKVATRPKALTSSRHKESPKSECSEP